MESDGQSSDWRDPLIDLIRFHSQSLGVHVLGQEAVVTQEEAVVAAGHVSGSASGDRPSGRNRSARNDHW